MPQDKTAPKTARSPLTGAVIPLGAHPGNTGGKKGRSGRRPYSLASFLATLRGNPDAHEALKRAAMDETCRNFGNTWKLAAEYDEEKPVVKTGLQGDIIIRVQFTRE